MRKRSTETARAPQGRPRVRHCSIAAAVPQPSCTHPQGVVARASWPGPCLPAPGTGAGPGIGLQPSQTSAASLAPCSSGTAPHADGSAVLGACRCSQITGHQHAPTKRISTTVLLPAHRLRCMRAFKCQSVTCPMVTVQ